MHREQRDNLGNSRADPELIESTRHLGEMRAAAIENCMAHSSVMEADNYIKKEE